MPPRRIATGVDTLKLHHDIKNLKKNTGKTITVSRKEPFQQYTTQGKMSDRNSKPSFAVSRNLKNAKYHFIEAKIDKLTEFNDTTPNCFNINLAMCNI